jgi:hypothetical protein
MMVFSWATRLMQPIEEIITLVAMRDKISVDEIKVIFDLPNNATDNIIDFLVKFDFIRLVESRYLSLGDACSQFFEEIISSSR